MKQNQMKAGVRALFGAMLLSTAALAQAQYMWLDDKGLKQLSDQPPPPSVPQNRILKQPRQHGTTLQQPAAAGEPANDGAAAPAAKPKTPAPPTVAERNADFNKRRADNLAAEQKSEQEAQQRANKAENCTLARNNQRALDDGIRMSTYDNSGQRVMLGDQERAERAKSNQKILADCPK